MKENFEIVRIQDVQEGTEQGLETLNLPAPSADELNPALAYLISLPKQLSRQTMTGALLLAAWTIWNRDSASVPRVGSPEALKTLREFPWGAIRAHHVFTMRAKLLAPDMNRPVSREGYSPKYYNKIATAVRQVSMKAKARKLMPYEACDEILQIKKLKVHRLASGAVVPFEDIAKVCVAAGKQKPNLARRDLAVIALLMAGLRRAEIASTCLDQYTATLRVRGKGDKERELPINPMLKSALDAWIQVRGGEPGPILLALTKHDTIRRDGALSPQTILDIVARLAVDAELKRTPSPHDFRRTFITSLLEQGVDLLRVAELAGHESVETTKIYDRRDMASKQKAVDAFGDAMQAAGIDFKQ